MKKKYSALILVLCLVIFQLSYISSADAAASSKPAPIAVQGALDYEIEAFLKAMGTYKTQKVDMYTFYTGEIDGIPVIVSRTEQGMVNAATATTLLIKTFHPRAIINQGTAGGHDESTHIYDIVVGTEQINYIYTNTPALKEGEGSHPENWQMISTDVRDENDNLVKYKTFKSTPELVEAAMSVAGKYTHGDVMTGIIGSADQFNNEVDRILWTNEVLGMAAEDMETASVAQVANSFDVPFVGIRGMSDAGRHDEHWTPETGRNTGLWTAEYVIEVIKAIDGQVDFATITDVNGFNFYFDESKKSVYLLDYQGEPMIPIRSFTALLGADAGTKVSFNNATKVTTVTYGTYSASFKPGQSLFTDASGTQHSIDAPAVIVNGKAYVSPDFLVEAFGFTTRRDDVDVYVNSK